MKRSSKPNNNNPAYCVCGDPACDLPKPPDRAALLTARAKKAWETRRQRARNASESAECAPDCASRVPFGECTCGRVDGEAQHG